MAIVTLTSNETGANSLIDINNNFADVTTSLALKADLVSPTFTGAPTLPTGTIATTQSQSDNSTKIATTAYVDTAVATPPENITQVATISVSSAEILTLNTVPKQLVAAPTAGKVIVVSEIVVSFTVGGAQYASGGDVFPVYSGQTANLFGTSASALIGQADVQGAASFIARIGNVTSVPKLLSATAVNLYASTANFTTGTGTMKVFIKYRTVTL